MPRDMLPDAFVCEMRTDLVVEIKVVEKLKF